MPRRVLTTVFSFPLNKAMELNLLQIHIQKQGVFEFYPHKHLVKATITKRFSIFYPHPKLRYTRVFQAVSLAIIPQYWFILGINLGGEFVTSEASPGVFLPFLFN
jgi:hypothetical protein